MNLESFKLKGYTTEVPATKSIAEIEKLLIKVGATKIMKDYLADETLSHISFKIDERRYTLPLNADGVRNIIYRTKSITTKQNDRVYRVACRILKDWLHAQLSLIASGQAEPDQVMLPYMSDGKRTLYELFKSGNLQLENKDGES